jgi:hypothetical protein
VTIEGCLQIGFSNLLGPLFLDLNTILACDISLELAKKIENKCIFLAIQFQNYIRVNLIYIVWTIVIFIIKMDKTETYFTKSTPYYRMILAFRTVYQFRQCIFPESFKFARALTIARFCLHVIVANFEFRFESGKGLKISDFYALCHLDWTISLAKIRLSLESRDFLL